jgi:hypothetical protein
MSKRSKGDPDDQLLLLPSLERLRPPGRISSQPPTAITQAISPARPPLKQATAAVQENERLISIKKGDAHLFYYARSCNLPPPNPVKQVLRKALLKLASKAAKSAMAGGTAVGIITTPIGEDLRACHRSEPEKQLELILPGPFTTEVHAEPQEPR